MVILVFWSLGRREPSYGTVGSFFPVLEWELQKSSGQDVLCSIYAQSWFP